MRIIQNLSDMISEEIADAGKYAECALRHKDDNPSLAETFYRLSMEEMQHMNMLHDQVVKIIDAYRKEKSDPPAEMMAVYNYLHEKQIGAASEVKAKQLLYKN